MSKKSLIEFPCHFPVKIIGTHSESFTSEIKSIIKNHFPMFKDSDLTQQPSKQNNYMAFTVNVYATNQTMLDAFYLDVTKHPAVKMVL